MGFLHKLTVKIYQNVFNRFSFLRKLRFEYTYKINKGFGELEYHKKIANDIAAHIPIEGHKSSLSLGCGFGFVCNKIAEKVPNLTGVDISETALSVARRYARKNVIFKRADVIKYREGKYDLIICCGILPYIPERNVKNVAKNIDKMLLPGGVVTIFEKKEYTGTRIEDYLSHLNLYKTSKKNIKVAGQNFFMWTIRKPRR